MMLEDKECIEAKPQAGFGARAAPLHRICQANLHRASTFWIAALYRIPPIPPISVEELAALG
jgi:hypothetical protein